jgi:hypothetical protein
MIDRKALGILILLCLATTAAAIWRLDLLPDWTQLPIVTPRGPSTQNGLVLFVPPLSLLFMITIGLAMNWLFSGPDEAIQIRQRRSRLLLLGTGVMTALAQAVIISRSLHLGLWLNPATLARAVVGVGGILTVMYGNIVPKLPRVSKRFAALNLDPWQSARSRRVAGWMTVALGLAMITVAVLLPLRAMAPTALALCAAYYCVCIWHFTRLKREPSPMP